jgi:formylglycine-generating enzyme
MVFFGRQWEPPDPTTAVTAEIPNAAASTGGFQPTLENRDPASGSSPKGMVWIPGGEFSMGANDPPDRDDVGMKATLDARPIHRVYVDGFFMDKTDVTNSQFAAFVQATRYITVEESTPRPEDFPGAPPENLVAGGVVFSPPPTRCLSMIICNGGAM